MLRRKGAGILLAALLTLLPASSAFGWHRLRPYPRHWVLYPGARAAAFHPLPPVLVGNWGEVDFNVHPQESLVYVDGILLGKADDVNGWPSTAHLKAGPHRVRIVSPWGESYQTAIYVQPGRELNFDYRFTRR